MEPPHHQRTRAHGAMAKAASFPVAVGGGGRSSYPAVAVAVDVPVDLGSGSEQKDHPPHYEPQSSAVHAAVVQLAIHAVVDDDDEAERRRRQRTPLLPFHHNPRLAAAKEHYELYMIIAQVALCIMTLVHGMLMIYLANDAQKRAQINWESVVTVSSVVVMFFSFLSMLLSYCSIYYNYTIAVRPPRPQPLTKLV